MSKIFKYEYETKRKYILLMCRFHIEDISILIIRAKYLFIDVLTSCFKYLFMFQTSLLMHLLYIVSFFKKIITLLSKYFLVNNLVSCH